MGCRKCGDKKSLSEMSNEEDIASLFKEIKVAKKTINEKAKDKSTKKKGATTVKCPRDGLYREKEIATSLSDQDFFESWRKKPNITVSKEAEGLKAREGVDRVVSFNQLQKLLSHNPKAGTTPNCPFDCDCCF